MIIIYECRDCGKFVSVEDIFQLHRTRPLSTEDEVFYYCKLCVEKRKTKQR